MDIDKVIKSRKSIREFNTKSPDWRDIVEAIDAARFAPMAGNNYTLKFIIIHNQEKIEKLAKAAQQDFIQDTQYVVVVCSVPERTINNYGERGKIYVRQQAGAAIQNFWLKLTSLGLSSCWVGAFSEPMIKRELHIPENVQVEALFPIGYVLTKTKTKKAKIEMDNILYFEKYANKKMKHIKQLET